jgi:hopanoid biosynthesis associated RND transporter like protein HpnN
VRVCACAALVAAGSLLLLPRLRFDANPLHVRDPSSEAVRTFETLLGDEEVNPWSVEVLAPDLEAADALARRVEALSEVSRAVTLSDWIPDDQPAKLARIEELAFMLPLDTLAPRPPPDREAVLASLASFGDEVRALADARGPMAEAARALWPALEGFRTALRDGRPREEALREALRASLVEPVVERLERLATALEAEPVTRETLPAPLRALMIAADGRARVQVFPAHPLDDEVAVERFVEAVRELAPHATGAAVYMLEAERTIVRALWEAFALAAALIVLVLSLLWRSPRDAALALAPLTLAALATAAAAVLAGLPINFANVIVLPLILGIGVDSGIHLVHRHRLGGHGDLLETSTSRAVLWSALTTIASFGSLGLASHRGMATLGQLLTLGVAMTLLANLVFLPALLALVDRRRSRARPAAPD